MNDVLPTAPVLRVRAACKRFGAVIALDGVTFDVAPSEVLALLGDNGAGKSTLIKILAGVSSPDEGQVQIDGESVHLSGPQEAKRRG
ncbi:MAG TPA: ATP-binding cassette domain-containing protein, partial [Nonomuraea sp.]|nr:ATP-binding cassette domain-containing protein [Nonomuraea sp.]